MTETPEATVNPAMLKLAGAAIGGYVLGRFKKGRKAIGLAMWLAGGRAGMDPKTLVRQGLMQLANTPEAKQLLGQVRGPMLEAGKHAAAATLETQMAALAKALENRTAALSSAGQEVAERGEDAAEETPRRLRSIGGRLTRRRGRPEEEGQPEEAEDRSEEELEEEPEGAEDEYDDEEPEEEETEEEEPEEEEPDEAPRQEARKQAPRKRAPRKEEPRKQAPRKEAPRKQVSRKEAPRKEARKSTGRTQDSGGDQPRKRQGQQRSAPEGRQSRRPRKEGARA